MRRVHKPGPNHQEFRNELLAVVSKHSDVLSAVDMLALASHLVGQIIALQDQGTMTRERALDIVQANIEQGNKEIIEGLLNPIGRG